jgi:hypothetical protein
MASAPPFQTKMNSTFAPKKRPIFKGKQRQPKALEARPAFESYRMEEPGNVVPLPSKIRDKLNGLARRHLVFAIWKLSLLVILWTAGLLFVQALLDVLAHLPLGVRAVFLLVDIMFLGGLILLGWDRIKKERLNLDRAALLVQKKWPSLRSSLIAAVQFTEHSTSVPNRSVKLVEKLLAQVSPQIERLHFQEVIPSRAHWRLTGMALLAWAILGMIAYDTMPTSRLLLKRILLSNEPFPTQTTVIPLSKNIVAGLGDNVQLEARAAGVIPNRGTVEIVQEDGTKEELTVSAQPDRADLFSSTIHNVQKAFSYRFRIGDGLGEKYQVKTRITPLVRQLDCVATYPSYTGLAPQKLSADQISVLAGSALQLRVTASTDLSRATLVYQGWTGKVNMKIDPGDPKVATLTLPVMDTSLTGFSIALMDRTGIPSVNDTVYHVDSIPDEPPTVRITKPTEESLTVTVHSKLQLVFEVSDNFGLTGISLHCEITPVAVGTEEPKPVEAKPINFDLKQIAFSPNTISTIASSLSVADQSPPWHEGDTVRYWIEAVDNNNVTGPGITRSNVQQLLVITPEAKRDEILQRLQDNANLMQDVLKDQSQINDEVKDNSPQTK